MTLKNVRINLTYTVTITLIDQALTVMHGVVNGKDLGFGQVGRWLLFSFLCCWLTADTWPLITEEVRHGEFRVDR